MTKVLPTREILPSLVQQVSPMVIDLTVGDAPPTGFVTKSHIIRLRLNKQLYKELVSVAAFVSASVPELTRQIIRDNVERYKNKRIYRDFLREI